MTGTTKDEGSSKVSTSGVSHSGAGWLWRFRSPKKTAGTPEHADMQKTSENETSSNSQNITPAVEKQAVTTFEMHKVFSELQGKDATILKKTVKATVAEETANKPIPATPVPRVAKRKSKEGTRLVNLTPLGYKVEYVFEETEPLTIEELLYRQAIKMYQCERMTMKVTPKFNSLVINSCYDVNIYITDVISQIEIFNSEKVNLYISGSCSAFSLDNIKGAHLYLSDECRDKLQIITSNAAETLLHYKTEVPKENEEGQPDGTEIIEVAEALPNQFVHSIKDGKIRSKPTENVGD